MEKSKLESLIEAAEKAEKERPEIEEEQVEACTIDDDGECLSCGA